MRLLKLILLFAISLSVSSCCKDEKGYGIRKLIGEWAFYGDVEKMNWDSCGQFERDTFCYFGNISMGRYDNEVKAKYSEIDSVFFCVDERGALYGFPTQYSSGEFIEEDVMHLYLRWGGLGGFKIHDIHCEKLK